MLDTAVVISLCGQLLQSLLSLHAATVRRLSVMSLPDLVSHSPTVHAATAGLSVACLSAMNSPKLQTLVYDILPSTTAVFSYAAGS